MGPSTINNVAWTRREMAWEDGLQYHGRHPAGIRRGVCVVREEGAGREGCVAACVCGSRGGRWGVAAGEAAPHTSPSHQRAHFDRGILLATGPSGAHRPRRHTARPYRARQTYTPHNVNVLQERSHVRKASDVTFGCR